MTDYEKYLDAATQILDEIKALDHQKKAIEARMTKLSALFLANINMLPDDVRKGIATLHEALKSKSGLTAAVTAVLTLDDMSAVDVRDAVMRAGYDLSDHVNPLASINTTLRRLADDDKILSREVDGRTVYRRKMAPRTRSFGLQPPVGPKK